MAQNNDRGTSRAILIARELPPDLRMHSEDTEEPRAYALLLDVLRGPAGSEIDATRAIRVNRGVEIGGMIAHQFPGGARLAPLVSLLAMVSEMRHDASHSVRFGIWQRPQQRCVNDAEDGGIGADAQGKGQNDDCTQGRRPAKHPQSVAKIEPNAH